MGVVLVITSVARAPGARAGAGGARASVLSLDGWDPSALACAGAAVCSGLSVSLKLLFTKMVVAGVEEGSGKSGRGGGGGGGGGGKDDNGSVRAAAGAAVFRLSATYAFGLAAGAATAAEGSAVVAFLSQDSALSLSLAAAVSLSAGALWAMARSGQAVLLVVGPVRYSLLNCARTGVVVAAGALLLSRWVKRCRCHAIRAGAASRLASPPTVLSPRYHHPTPDPWTLPLSLGCASWLRGRGRRRRSRWNGSSRDLGSQDTRSFLFLSAVRVSVCLSLSLYLSLSLSCLLLSACVLPSACAAPPWTRCGTRRWDRKRLSHRQDVCIYTRGEERASIGWMYE